MTSSDSVCIIGGGNLGECIARGLVSSGRFEASRVAVTRRRPELLSDLAADGHPVGSDNVAAVRYAGLVVLSVQRGSRILPMHMGLTLEVGDLVAVAIHSEDRAAAHERLRARGFAPAPPEAAGDV